MKKKQIIVMLTALTVAAGMLFGCTANVDFPDQGSDKEEVSETEEEEPAEAEDKADQSADEEKTEAEEDASAEEEAGEITYVIKSVTYDTKIDNFGGRTDILEITDNGHDKLKKAVDEWFEKYRSDFEAQCAEFESDAEEAKKMAEEDGGDDDSEFYSPQYSLDYSVMVSRADESMFSLALSEYSFMGGAHGGTYVHGVNFDTKTGELIDNTEFDDTADSVKEYILKDIDDSGKEAEDMLFPEYKDTIDSMFSDGMKNGAFWFDGRGMIYAFQQYDIAPYASGILMFDIPYKEMKGFPEKYVSDGSFYTVDIPTNGFTKYIDLDGKEEKVYLEIDTEEDSYYSTFKLHVGDRQLDFGEDEGYYYCEPMFVHSSEGDFFMFVATSDNDFNRIYMFDAEGDFDKIDDMDGSFRVIRDGEAVIAQRHNSFGTWAGIKDYTYDIKGFHTDETVYRIDNDPRTDGSGTGIKLIKDLKYSETSGDYSDTKVLEKGTVIYPISDSGSELGFVTEDGEEGFFEYERDENGGEALIDGVNENDMFESLPYAG